MTSNQSKILFKKNIILIPSDYDGISNQKGVLSLEVAQDKVFGTIRCFNLKPTDEIYSIGISTGDGIFKTTASAKELSNLKVELNVSVNNSPIFIKSTSLCFSTILTGLITFHSS